MALATIEISKIEVGKRLRGLSEIQVESLVASIAEVGLLNPITVYPREQIVGGVSVPGYGLVAGAHRLEASKRLGLVEIDAQVVQLGDLERQIAECDENLCGSVLSKSERALFTKRRKDAYEALHPEAKHGGDRKSDQVANIATRSFSEDQSEKTGVSERLVRLDAERGEKVIPEALEMLRGTHLDTGAYLDKIKRLPPNEQVFAVKRDLAFERQKEKPRPVKHADDPHNDFEVKERQVSALMAAWNKAGRDAREEFLARIDAPVFDRSAA